MLTARGPLPAAAAASVELTATERHEGANELQDYWHDIHTTSASTIIVTTTTAAAASFE